MTARNMIAVLAACAGISGPGRAPAQAQTTTVSPSIRLGVTTLTLAQDVSNGTVAPAPGSRVRVPPYEEVHLRVPDGWTYSIQWVKNGQPIAGATGRELVLPLVVSSDTGTYNITGAPSPIIATGISLDVVPSGHTANFSSRLELASGTGSQTIGFVVAGQTSASFLFRAVGPSLAAFGIAHPAATPHFRCFDSTGKQVIFARVQIVWDWPATFATVGAFPLTGGEQQGTAYDVYVLTPGAYTIQVSDDSGQGGTVLFEAYDGASLIPEAYILPSVTPSS